MSEYYNPHRKPDWNYGGPKFRLSRSKIELFMECPRCFYLDNNIGTARPRGPSFTLNVAVDALLKKEFDIHRAKNQAHPLMQQYGIDAVPFSHPKLDVWRENFKGIEFKHAQTGFVVSGAVDDIWVNSKGELIVVDYKATSKDGSIDTLADSSWQKQYQRQMGVYQWLLRQNGFSVSDTGYFVYVNAKKDREAFDGKLDFDVTLVPCEGDSDWVDVALVSAKACLDSGSAPEAASDCDYCAYRKAAGEALQALAGSRPKAMVSSASKKRSASKKEESTETKTLF